ncbi:hypothetical protein ACQJBY_014306 [Aegilops geniculata]
MVAELGPGRFYGGGLPRPRVFPGGDRADPPALLSWAREAQWSTGARGGRRLRLQGRIEGSLGRLRRADALGSDDDDEDGGVAAQEREAVHGKEEEDEESGESEEDVEESGESEDEEESSESEELALLTPARGLQRKKAVAAASAPSAKLPAKASPKTKRKAAAAALTARTPPTRKRKAAEAPAAGRRAKH